MAHKLVKFIRSKGERLGWTPIDQVKFVTLKSVTVRGRRVPVRQHQELNNKTATPKLLIP